MFSGITKKFLKYLIKKAVKNSDLPFSSQLSQLYAAGASPQLLKAIKDNRNIADPATILTNLLNSDVEVERALREEGRKRAIGMGTRVGANILLPLASDAIGTVGKTVQTATNLVPAALAAAGMATPQTGAEQFMGMPNIGGAAAGVLNSAAAPLQTLIAGATGAAQNATDNLGEQIMARAQERKILENSIRTLSDMPTADITPSQARIAEQQYRQNREAAKLGKAASGGR